MKTSAATLARQRAGISIEEMAKRARLSSTRYLREIEIHGCSSYDRAVKLSRLYGCAPDVFRRRRHGLSSGQFPMPPAATGADTTQHSARAGRGSTASQHYRPRRLREPHLKVVQ